jgi:hypothetical protein
VSTAWKEAIANVAAAPEALWVLTNLGHIFIRFSPEGAFSKEG